MVYRNGGHAQTQCERLGKRRADQQGAGQPRSLRIGDRANLAERAPAIGKRLAQQRNEPPHMVPRGELRNDATVVAVHRNLRVQGVREQAALLIGERDARFVAGRFEAEDPHGAAFYPTRSGRNPVDLEKA